MWPNNPRPPWRTENSGSQVSTNVKQLWAPVSTKIGELSVGTYGATLFLHVIVFIFMISVYHGDSPNPSFDFVYIFCFVCFGSFSSSSWTASWPFRLTFATVCEKSWGKPWDADALSPRGDENVTVPSSQSSCPYFFLPRIIYPSIIPGDPERRKSERKLFTSCEISRVRVGQRLEPHIWDILELSIWFPFLRMADQRWAVMSWFFWRATWISSVIMVHRL